MHDRAQCRSQTIEYFYIDTNPYRHTITISTSSADQYTAANLDAAADLDTTAVFYSISYLDSIDHSDTVQYTHFVCNIMADQYASAAYHHQYADPKQYALAITNKPAASNKDSYTSVDKYAHTHTDLDAQVWI